MSCQLELAIWSRQPRMAAMLGNSVVVVRTRPIALITMRKLTHGFPILFYMNMGLRY